MELLRKREELRVQHIRKEYMIKNCRSSN